MLKRFIIESDNSEMSKVDVLLLKELKNLKPYIEKLGLKFIEIKTEMKPESYHTGFYKLLISSLDGKLILDFLIRIMDISSKVKTAYEGYVGISSPNRPGVFEKKATSKDPYKLITSVIEIFKGILELKIRR